MEQELLTLTEHLQLTFVFCSIFNFLCYVIVSLFVLFFCVVCFYGFCIPLWYLRFTTSVYPFGILDLRLLYTPLVSSNFSFSLFFRIKFLFIIIWSPAHIVLCFYFIFLRLVYPMLSSCVPYVVVLCTVCCRLVYPMLPVSLECPF